MNSTYHEQPFIMKISVPARWVILLLFLSLVHISVAHAEDPFFSIALSKFSNEQDAKKEEAKLKKSGHNAFYREEKSSDNKTEYQVYIEKYNTKDEAEKEAMVLKDLELIPEYTVKEVRSTPRTIPEQNTAPEENNTETALIPRSTEVKKQPQEPGSAMEQPTTAPEPSPVISESEIGSPSDKDKTKTGMEPSPAVNKVRQKVISPPQKNKAKPYAETHSAAKKSDHKPVSKPEPKAEPEKKIKKLKPVTNHNDARLTGASLQVGSFKDKTNAEELKLKLKNLGKNTFYRYESADNMGKFYRLYITGYSSLRAAIKDAKELVKSGVISSYSRVLSEGSDPVSSDSLEPAEVEGKIYIIHVSSNKDEANAKENVARLKKYGYKAFYAFEKDSSGSWYRVYIGKFKDEADARNKGMELLERGLISYFKPIPIDRKKLDN